MRSGEERKEVALASVPESRGGTQGQIRGSCEKSRESRWRSGQGGGWGW